jgi:hypothetical protein
VTKYNAAFFGLYETFFLQLKKKFGAKGVKLWQDTMAGLLEKAYVRTGAKRGSGTENFIKHVGMRDKSVGLKVSFRKTPSGFIYRFHTDPFPNLRGKTSWKPIVDAYLKPKMAFFLGNGWVVHTTKHIWDGAPYTEHVFEKSY